ncbi:hypothetical protein Droror1_Dr00006379 [Drosera rotundifolia]
MAAEAATAPKVIVHLRATGDAPILKQAKFKISGSDKFGSVIDFLRRQLHRETLFVYVNSAFSPNPDELVLDLYNVSYRYFSLVCTFCISLDSLVNTQQV